MTSEKRTHFGRELLGRSTFTRRLAIDHRHLDTRDTRDQLAGDRPRSYLEAVARQAGGIDIEFNATYGNGKPAVEP